MDWCSLLEPDAPELQVGMDLFRFGPIPGHDRMSGVDALEDAAIDIGDKPTQVAPAVWITANSRYAGASSTRHCPD